MCQPGGIATNRVSPALGSAASTTAPGVSNRHFQSDGVFNCRAASAAPATTAIVTAKATRRLMRMLMSPSDVTITAANPSAFSIPEPEP